MSRRRVLMTTDVVGGVWDFALMLAMQLSAASSTKVTLLALGEPSADQVAAAEAADVDLIAARLKLEWMQDAADDIAATRRLVADVAREISAHVVHANQFAAACADVRIPVVLTLHSDVLSWRRWTLGATGVSPEWQPYADLAAEALWRANHLVAVSAFLAQQVVECYGVARAIQVIHNGWPAPPPAPRRADPPITLLAGRVWDAAKNIPLASEATRGWQPGEVWLAGTSVNPETGGSAPPVPGLAPLGPLSRHALDACLRRAAVYVSPARYDPFGLLPLQAALSGCALVLSDIPSYRELWSGAACFFRSEDVADLRRQWQRVLADHDYRAELQRACGAHARQRFGVERMAAAYAALYARERVAA